MKPDRWQRAAERENTRRDSRAPLFAHAGLVPHTTPADVSARTTRLLTDMEERMAAKLVLDVALIARMREELLSLVGTAGLAAFDERRRHWPRTHEYELDGLTEDIAKALSVEPIEVHDRYHGTNHAAVFRDIDAALRKAEEALPTATGPGGGAQALLFTESTGTP